jgi:hypothetical protein
MQLPRLLVKVIDPAGVYLQDSSPRLPGSLFRGGAVCGPGVPGGARQATMVLRCAALLSPVELMLGCACSSAVDEGFVSCGLVTVDVPEHPVGEHHYVLFTDLKVGVPTVIGKKRRGQATASSSARSSGASKSRKVHTFGWVADAEDDTSTRPTRLTTRS